MTPIRSIWIFVLAFCSACGAAQSPGAVPSQSRWPSPSETATTVEPSPSGESLPEPNVRGRDVRLVAEHGEDHPSPEVLPRSPQNLVVGDCDGLVLFDVDDYEHAEEYVALHWWDVGVEKNRSLTILTSTPSCLAHQGVRYLASYMDRY